METLARILDALKEREVKRISFGGGEPTSHPKLRRIVQLTKSKGFLTAMSTNGMKIGRNSGILKALEGYLDEVIIDYHATRAKTAQVFSPYMDTAHRKRVEVLFREILQWNMQLKVATVMFKHNAALEMLERIAQRLEHIGVRIWKIDQYYFVPWKGRYGNVEQAFAVPDRLYENNLGFLRREHPSLKIIGVGAKFRRRQMNFMISPGGHAFVNNCNKTQPLGNVLKMLEGNRLLPKYMSPLPVGNYRILA